MWYMCRHNFVLLWRAEKRDLVRLDFIASLKKIKSRGKTTRNTEMNDRAKFFNYRVFKINKIIIVNNKVFLNKLCLSSVPGILMILETWFLAKYIKR